MVDGGVDDIGKISVTFGLGDVVFPQWAGVGGQAIAQRHGGRGCGGEESGGMWGGGLETGMCVCGRERSRVGTGTSV